MQNLRTAIKAFWCVLTSKPHVYCDDRQHAVVGTEITAAQQIRVLISALNQEVGQQQVLAELRDIIDE